MTTNDSKYYNPSEPTLKLYFDIIDQEAIKLSTLLNANNIPCTPKCITYNLDYIGRYNNQLAYFMLAYKAKELANPPTPENKFYALRFIYRTLGWTIAKILNNQFDKYPTIYKELSNQYPDTSYNHYHLCPTYCPKDIIDCMHCPLHDECYKPIKLICANCFEPYEPIDDAEYNELIHYCPTCQEAINPPDELNYFPDNSDQ